MIWVLLAVFAYLAWVVLSKIAKCRWTRRSNDPMMFSPPKANHDWSKRKDEG